MRDYVIINMANVVHQNTKVAFSHSCVGTSSRLILQPLLHILLPFIVVLIDSPHRLWRYIHHYHSLLHHFFFSSFAVS